MTQTETKTEPTPAKPRPCSQHHQDRSLCLPEQTHVYSVSISIRERGDLMAEVERKARESRLDRSGAVTAALQMWTGADGCAHCKQADIRAEAAEAELAEVRAALAKIQRAMGMPATMPSASTDKFERFALALEKATPAFPARPRDLAAVSRYHPSRTQAFLAGLMEDHCVTSAVKGGYVPVPGADIREGMRAILAREAAGRAESRAASRRPPEARTEPPAAVSAPGRKAPRQRKADSPVAASPDRAPSRTVTIERLREEIPDVTAASELERPAARPGYAAFQEPEGARIVIEGGPKSCPPHPKRRVNKGLCGLCGRNVEEEELA